MEQHLQNAMSILEKAQSLLSSRRFWLTVAQLAILLVGAAGMVGQVFGVEIDADLPGDEALADTLLSGFARLAVIAGAILALLKGVAGLQNLTVSYTARPPGVDDRGFSAQPAGMTPEDVAQVAAQAMQSVATPPEVSLAAGLPGVFPTGNLDEDVQSVKAEFAAGRIGRDVALIKLGIAGVDPGDAVALVEEWERE